jgi:hypothetical protein
VLVDDGLRQIIAALAEDPDAAAGVLAPAFRDHIHLAPDRPVTIMRIDFAEIATAAEAVRIMERGEIIRLRIGAGGGEQMLYVRYPTPEDAAIADPPQ